MKKYMIHSLILFSLLLCNNSSFAQHNHSHGNSHDSELTNILDHPPHHGLIKIAGKYYIELVVDWMGLSDKVKVYLFKKSNEKAVKLSPEISGSISYLNSDGKVLKTEELEPHGDDGYKSQLDNSKGFNCKIKFEVKGKEIEATFIEVSPDF